jgi:acyl-CoA dehydrogenase
MINWRKAVKFEFTEQQQLLRKGISDFVRVECPKDYMRELDEKEQYPHSIWDKLAQAGWLGLTIPEKYGGSGGNVLDVVIVVEELAKAMTALGTMYLTNSCFAANSVGAYGTDEQKQRFLPKIASGSLKMCFGVTEPNTGVDTLSMRTFAMDNGENFIVNGQKVYITGAHVADYIILLVRTEKNVKKRSHGLSILMLDAKSEGIEIRLMRKLGLRALGTCEVFLDDVEVSKEYLLGQKNEGWRLILHTMNNERITVSAYRIGNAMAAFEDALRYAKERIVFGRPIGQFQAIQHRLAEMYMDIELSRMMMYKAAWLQSEGKPCEMEANIAKYASSETVVRVCQSGMRIMAGHGYMMEVDMQRYYRDAILAPTGTSTQELIKGFIGVRLGLPKSF